MEYSEKNQAVAVRREMEAMFRNEFEERKAQPNGVNGSQ